MKHLIALLLLTFSANCQAQFQVSDASLKIDTMSLITACDCNAAIILHMEEVIKLLEEVKRIQKKGSTMPLLEEEVWTRDKNHYRLTTRCMPIYKKEHGMGHCPNSAEGEALDKKVSSLRKELKMQ